jgi:DNA-directed RNA polymerase specialized sigma24 family protein
MPAREVARGAAGRGAVRRGQGRRVREMDAGDRSADGGSITRWIGDLKAGDHRAAHHLWGRYFRRLVALARAKLGGAARAVADEEDAALSALHRLCDGAARGRFDRLRDRDDLWRLLVVITARKVIDLKKGQGRLRRGGGRVLTEAALAGGGDADGSAGLLDALEQFAAAGPSPEAAAQLAEEYQRRLEALGDASLRRVAELRLEGYGHDEIAERLGCARRTVARKLEMIRLAWEGDAT